MTAIRELEARVLQPFFKERKKATFHPINCGRCGDLTEVTGNRQKYCEPCAKEIKAEQDKTNKKARYNSDPEFRERTREINGKSEQKARGERRQSRPPGKTQKLQIKRLEREMKIAAENPGRVQKILGSKHLFTVGKTDIPVYFSLKEKPHFSFRFGEAEFSFDARSAVKHYGEKPFKELREITHPTHPDRLKKKI